MWADKSVFKLREIARRDALNRKKLGNNNFSKSTRDIELSEFF